MIIQKLTHRKKDEYSKTLSIYKSVCATNEIEEMSSDFLHNSYAWECTCVLEGDLWENFGFNSFI